MSSESWSRLDGLRLSSGHVLKVSAYRTNDRPALVAYDEEWVPECHVTVNLVDELLGDDEFHVRFEDREHAGAVFDALVADGLAEPTGRVVGAGYVPRYAEVWRLLEEEG